MRLQRIIDEFFRTLVHILEELATAVGRFPTVVANAILPLPGLTIGFELNPRRQGDFEGRIAEITSRLKQSGSDAQRLLDELEQVMDARRQQVLDAQQRLQTLEVEESEVKERVQLLQAVQPEAAVAINNLLDESLEARDRRGAKRDWLIFVMGIAVSAAISLVFYLLAK